MERRLVGIVDGESEPTITELKALIVGSQILQSTDTREQVRNELQVQITERVALLTTIEEDLGV